MKNLNVPKGKIDVVLDTDAFNEIDDQFAVAYLLLSKDRICAKALYAAPFYNKRSNSPADGMEKSYRELLKIREIMGENLPVKRGSTHFLADENTPEHSEAAVDLASRAMDYTPEHPLYVVAIGAITNIASAILMHPEIAGRIVVVWLGGHAHHYGHTYEFNMYQDIAAARVVMGSGVPFVQLPCYGVVSAFTVSEPELRFWLRGKNPLADYLVDAAITEANSYAEGKPWTRCIWDVTAVAWLLNDTERFMRGEIKKIRLPDYSERSKYEAPLDRDMHYVYYIKRDALMEDLISKIRSFQ